MNGPAMASSKIPHFWQTPYLRYCLDNVDVPIKFLMDALKNISGTDECNTSFERLKQAKAFVLISKNISVLTPLEEFTQIEQLFLSNNVIEDLSLLSGLTHLEILFLSGNKVRDLTPLKGLTQLKKLYLSDNQITNVSPLVDLPHLEILVINRNPIIRDDFNCPTHSRSAVVNSACLEWERNHLKHR